MSKGNHRVRTAMWLITFAVVLFTVVQNIGEVFNALSFVWGVCSAIVAGLCIAFVLNVFMVFIEEHIEKLVKLIKLKRRPGLIRGVSLFLTLAMVIGFLLLIIRVVAPRIVEIVEMIISMLPEVLNEALVWMEDTLKLIKVSPEQIEGLRSYVDNLSDNLIDVLKDSVAAYASFAINFTTGLLGGLIDTILSIFISLYVLTEKEKISRACARFCDAYLSEKFKALYDEFSGCCFDKFSCFIKGQITEAFLLGAMCFVGMLIFGFPHAVMISMLVGAASLVPVIGPWVGSIVSILLILLTDPLKALLFAIFILVLQQIEDNLIYPRVVGRSMGLPGLLVLCAVIVGSNTFGVLGILLAVPLFGVFYELARKRVSLKIAARGRAGDKPAPPGNTRESSSETQ